MSQDDRNAWVYEKVKSAMNLETREVEFRIRGHVVCPKAFRTYYYLTEYRYYKARRLALGESPFLPHGNSFRYYSSPKADSAKDFMGFFIDRYCDIMPHIDVISLPPKMEKADVWNEYIKYCEDRLMLEPEYLCSLSHFLEVPACVNSFRKSSSIASTALVDAISVLVSLWLWRILKAPQPPLHLRRRSSSTWPRCPKSATTTPK